MYESLLLFRLLNSYRNCILTTTSDQAVNEQPENRKQVSPQVMFDFIESELRDVCLVALPSKIGQSGNGGQQGQFTKAGAAALLVRLYLNAEKWIGQPKWQECIDMCERITGGEFGYYAIADNWYEPFDWNNEMCNEVILGFPGSYGLTSWHLKNDKRTVYGRALPYGCEKYLKIEGDGSRNPKYALSPSYNNQQPRALFDYELGMVTQKFAKYAGDKRYKQYVNTSNNTREGMFFMEGKIANSSISGEGTLVWLNAGSKMSYAQDFGINERSLNLSGEAYFEVTRNEEIPFKVHTEELDVKVLGTKFNFRNYKDDLEAKVCLLEGKVALNTRQKETILHPDQQALLDKKTGKLSVSDTKAAYSAEWTNDRLYFDEILLSDIIKELERSYDVKITVADDTLNTIRFYGNFRKREQSIQEIMNVLSSTDKMTYTMNGKNIVITLPK